MKYKNQKGFSIVAVLGIVAVVLMAGFGALKAYWRGQLGSEPVVPLEPAVFSAPASDMGNMASEASKKQSPAPETEKPSTPAPKPKTSAPVVSSPPAPEPKPAEAVVTPAVPVETVHEIDLQAWSYAYSRNKIEVSRGEKARIIMKNTGGYHNFVIKHPDLSIESPAINDGETTIIEFIPQTSGVYEFYCSIGNHAELGMTGLLIVR